MPFQHPSRGANRFILEAMCTNRNRIKCVYVYIIENQKKKKLNTQPLPQPTHTAADEHNSVERPHGVVSAVRSRVPGSRMIRSSKLIFGEINNNCTFAVWASQCFLLRDLHQYPGRDCRQSVFFFVSRRWRRTHLNSTGVCSFSRVALGFFLQTSATDTLPF